MLEREKQAAEKAAASAAKNADVFGDLPLIQSQVITGRTWTRCVPAQESVGRGRGASGCGAHSPCSTATRAPRAASVTSPTPLLGRAS